MGKKIQRWLKLLMLVIFIGSAAMYGYHTVQTKQSQEAYEKAAELAAQEKEARLQEELRLYLEKQDMERAARESEAAAQASREAAEAAKEELVEVRYWKELPVEDDPYIEVLEQKNLEPLREVNEDVLGWIVIPDTKLDYPLMRGEDNDYYLKRNWEGKSNVAGSIFMEQLNDKDFRHFNTVIYGHRMKNGTMFGSLKNYASKSYWEKHPYLYILDDAGVHRYEIFSVYEATLEENTYQIGFADDESKQTFIDNCIGYSDIDTGVVPTVEDRIITLSTCIGAGYDSRWVVQARRKGEIIARMEPKKTE